MSGAAELRSVELFAGAGGLAMGLKEAGFAPEGIVEFDKHACNTLRANPTLADKEIIFEGDVAQYSYSKFGTCVDLVSGGPPCQPFSIGGKGKGNSDKRDMFPEAVRAIRELAPRAFIFENVKGLLRKSFSEYFSYIILQLEFPCVSRDRYSSWQDHLCALKSYSEDVGNSDLCYDVSFKLLNSANFGVPQKRERVFIVGFRRDLKVDWSFPKDTHSEEALLIEKWVDKSYWERHGIIAPKVDPKLSKLVAQVEERYGLFPPSRLPWVTVRDAIHDLPDPTSGEKCKFSNHEFKGGARSYPGHTGSYIDLPSKALKAGVHGVPGGENMIRFENGSVRYFTVRESARIQTFPDTYQFKGSWGEVMRQLGNAVPARLAKVVGDAVAKKLGAVDLRCNQAA